MNSGYTRSQISTLVAFGTTNFFNACCISLLAPFFPNEAEKKGASAFEYGIVMGVFELVVFLVSPYYGKKIGIIGPKKMFYAGILIPGLCSIIFGLLNWVDGHLLFIYSALVIRIFEALGNAAFLTASFSILVHEFSGNVATTFALLETCFGMGLIVGPLLGGVLYEIGGFPTPFIVLGTVLLLIVFIIKSTLLLPDTCSITNRHSRSQLLELLRIQGIPLCSATVMVTSISMSFFSTTLEPHMRQFHIKPVFLGCIFVIMTASYGASAPVWGWLCDHYVRPKAISVTGGIILLIGISFVGPAPYLPLQATLNFVIFGQILHGLGVGARLASTFGDILQIATFAGMTNDIDTHGLISGLWTSSFALGAFLGPTASGFLFDNLGFANASLFIVFLVSVLVILEAWNLSSAGQKGRQGYDTLPESHAEDDLLQSTFRGDRQTFLKKLSEGAYQNIDTAGNGGSNIIHQFSKDYSSDEREDTR